MHFVIIDKKFHTGVLITTIAMNVPEVILFFVAYCTLAVNGFEIKETEWITMKNLVASQQEMIKDMKQSSLEFERKVVSEIKEMNDNLKRQDDEIRNLKEKNYFLENELDSFRLKKDLNRNEGKSKNKTGISGGVTEKVMLSRIKPETRIKIRNANFAHGNSKELFRQGTYFI